MTLKTYLKSEDFKSTVKALAISGTIVASVAAFGEGDGEDDVATLGTLADNIRGTFSSIAQMMMGISYIAGVGFFIGAIFKFKQHKDNPTQIPMGTPIALLMIAVCLVFMPYIISTSGATFTGQGGDAGIGSPDGTKLPGVSSGGS